MTNKIQLDPSSKTTLTMRLYRNVKNVPELRKKLMKGSLQCCIIKPNLIVDPFQVIVASNKAVTAEKLTTRTIYSEILHNLSVSKNITQNLQKFGVGDNDRDIIVVTLSKDEEDIENVFRQVKGEERDLGELKDLTDFNEVKEIYKIREDEAENGDLIDSIVTRIATKEFASV